jgi:hypothetical protein
MQDCAAQTPSTVLQKLVVQFEVVVIRNCTTTVVCTSEYCFFGEDISHYIKYTPILKVYPNIHEVAMGSRVGRVSGSGDGFHLLVGSRMASWRCCCADLSELRRAWGSYKLSER